MIKSFVTGFYALFDYSKYLGVKNYNTYICQKQEHLEFCFIEKP